VLFTVIAKKIHALFVWFVAGVHSSDVAISQMFGGQRG
jgi:hypothetical protein